MQPVIHNCSRCENEIIVACYPPKGRDPQEAGTIFPADCPVCGAELCDAPHVESCNVKDPDEAPPLMSQAEIDKDAATGRGYEGLV